MPSQKVFRTTLLFCVIALSWGLSARGEIISESARKFLLEHLGHDIGPLVPRNNSPELYDAIEKAVLTLQRAREHTQNEVVNSLGHIYILNSPKHFVFTLAKTATGTRKEEQLVYITTGAIRDLFEETSAPTGAGNKLKAGELGMLRIIGALAPTIAHPFSADNALGHIFQSQENGMVADQLGIVLLREAGYPVEAALAAKERLDIRPPAASANDAARNWTAEKNLALSAQRLALTLGRYEHGVQKSPLIPKVPMHIAEEVDRLDPEKEWRFQPPSTIQQATDALGPLSQKPERERARLAINQLVLWVDNYFFRKGQTYSADDLRELHGFLSKLAQLQTERDWIYSNAEFERAVTKRNTPAELLIGSSHRDFMQRIPAYQSPEHLNWVGRTFVQGVGSWTKAGPDGVPSLDRYAMNPLSAVASLPDVISLYGTSLAKSMPVSDPKDHRVGPRTGPYVLLRGRENDPEFQVRMGELLYREFWKKLTPQQKIKFVLDTPLLRNDPMTMQKQQQGSGGPDSMASGELKAIEQRHAQEIWNDRGFWATMEFLSPEMTTDWERIWKVLGISPTEGKRELNAAVRVFTSGPEYADYLQAMSDQPSRVANTLTNGNSIRNGRVARADDSLFAFLIGEKVGKINQSPRLKLVAAGVAKGYLGLGTNPLRARVAEKLKEALDGRQSLTPEQVTQIASRLSAEIYGNHEVPHRGEELVWATAIRQSKLSAQNKAALLKKLFLSENGLFPPYQWMRESPEFRAIAAELVAGGAAPSFLDLALSQKPVSEYAAPVPPVYRAIGNSRIEILRELSRQLDTAATSQEKTQILRAFVEKLLFNGDKPSKYETESHGPIPEVESKEIGQLKAGILSLTRKAGLSDTEIIALVERLAITGKTPEMDRFLVDTFASHPEELLPEPTAAALSQLLKKGGVLGAVAQGKLAQAVLEGRVRTLKKKGATRPQIEAVLEDIEGMAPKGSQVKDQLLENVALRLGLRQTALRALVEEQKSKNWKKQDPLLANLGSAVSHELQKLSRPALLHTLEYLLDSRSRAVPPDLARTIEDSIYDDLVEEKLQRVREDLQNRGVKGTADQPIDYAQLREKAHTRTNEFLRKLETELIGASPTDRIPFIELLLNSGPNPLAKDPDFPLQLSRQYLTKIQPGSRKEKMLLAFLKVVPKHERTASLAYLLSQTGRDKSGVRSLFEVFQTVGIKFGQLSSVWELFGPEIARETAGLKENARKLSLAEIEDLVVRDLGPKKAENIRILDILGCGGISCSVKIEYQSNSGKRKKGVMLVKRPNAVDQINGNIRLTRDYLVALREEGVELPDGVYEDLLTDLDSQLVEELDFEKLAKNIRQARKDFQELNTQMKEELGEHTHFEVPDLLSDFAQGAVHENLVFMEYADGLSWEKLVHEEKNQRRAEAVRGRFGPLIQKANILRFFRKGRLNADVHGGNVLINPRTGIIYPIDFGQDESFSITAPWREDEIGKVSNFLREVNGNDPDRTLAAAIDLAKPDARPDAYQRAQMRSEIASLLAQEKLSPEKKLLELRAIFARNGLRLERKYSFGMMKGLLIQAREGYVSPPEFAAMVRAEVKRKLITKIPHRILGVLCNFGALLRIW